MKNKKTRKWIREWGGELLLTALFVPLFWYLMDTGFLNDAALMERAQTVTLAVLLGAALLLVLTGRMTWERAAGLLVLAGLAMRIGYALGTQSYIRHHDYGDIQWYVYGHSEELGVHDYGHAPYVLYLYLNRTLPHFNVGQFYHPPLYHILAAISMRAAAKLLKIEDLIYLFEASKIISCLASCYTLLLVPKLLRELDIKKAGKCLAVGVMAFLPMFYLMAGWTNNDGLVFFFMVWIVLYTVRWYGETSWKNTFCLAAGFGFGMMSKMSCALLAFFTGAVMLEKLVQVWREEKEGKRRRLQLFGRLAGFAAVAFPLGLAYPIRNYLKFGQPLNYVLELNIPPVPVKDFLQRFVLFPVGRLFSPVFADSEEYNLNLFLLKTSSFGEFSYPAELEPLGIAVTAANLVLILLALAGIVLVWRTDRNIFWRWGFWGTWLFFYAMTLRFAVRYPYPCSMDARYLAITVLFGALYLGKAAEVSGRSAARRAVNAAAWVALTVLAAGGILFFLRL